MWACARGTSQLPLTNQIGQYNTNPHVQFTMESQMKLKRELMQHVNNYSPGAPLRKQEISAAHFS